MQQKRKNYPPSRRGKKKTEEIVKDETIVFRVSHSERRKIAYLAASYHNTISGYCREIVLGHEPVDRDQERVWRLKAVGLSNNLNQITKELNTYGVYGDIVDRIESLIKKIEE